MRLISLSLLLMLFSCEKTEYNEIEIVGHAGMGLDMQNSIYHDNSLEAIQLALSYGGSNGVEVDVQMDNEGCLWLFHDELMDGIASMNGCINEKTTNELEKVTYKTLKKERLTKLQPILEIIPSNQKLFLDIKDFNACADSYVDANIFISSLNKLAIEKASNVFLIVSNEKWLSQISSKFKVFFSTDDLAFAKDLIDNNANISGLVIRNKMINKSEVELIRKMGKQVFLYDLRSPKGNRTALDKNPNGIITDDIRAALIERN